VDSSPEEFDAVVIGAGFAGLYMCHKLRDHLGLRVAVLEAEDGVGGTWRLNRYPGARCDIESFVYCYSFSRELYEEWEWTSKYPAQEEILRYLEHVADRFDLRRSIRLGTRVTSAEFDGDQWRVTTAAGAHLRARFLITGVGLLASAPFRPDFPGLETFAGRWCHTGAWPREGMELEDLAGKRVGVIGTGSSGVQTIPVIAEVAEHLTVFQRTPQYAIPAQHHTIGPDELRRLRHSYDEVWEQAHSSLGGFPCDPIPRSVLDDTPEQRTAEFERLWQRGGLHFVLATYQDLLFDIRANQHAADFARDKIAERVRDPRMLELLLPPKDLPIGAKRPIIETGYFETYDRDNVALIDIRADPIVEVTPTGIRTENDHHDLDVIVLATGFDAVTGPLLRLNISGRDGVALSEQWAQGPASYLGLAISGFPNLFTITGPGSTFGNIPVVAEHHIDWISDLIGHMLDTGYARVEATPEAQQEWTATMARLAAKSLIPLADSWSTGANIPGKPRTVLFYLGAYSTYRKRCDAIAAEGYRGFVFER
jgi:cation diffusion facilitator CzcD-associated flavoprotein CzcO